MKLVSVVMSTYKEPISYIRLAVESILTQSYSNIEFIIIIDAPDNVQLAEVLKEYQHSDKRIKIVYNEKNLGLTESLNKGLQYCSGDYIARMDADDISSKDRIEKQMKYLESEGLDLVASNYERFFDEKETGDVLSFPTDYQRCKKRLRYGNCIPHPIWFAKKEVFFELKGYRDIKTCEDYDFILRAIEKGYKVANCPEVLLRYRYNKESISRKGEAEQNVVTMYLASCYRKGACCAMKEYESFLNSQKYMKYVKRENKLIECKNNYKEESILLNKLMAIIRLFTNLLFWKKKIRQVCLKYI
ncbi:MAG: glycosyltransferase [Lachnospiraceae bacterium]|nr:glycosyltransferase [Lachnospiraceae bacterium]